MSPGPGRASRAVESGFLAFSAAAGAWSAPFLASAALGTDEPSAAARLGCLVLLAVCWAATWWLVPEPRRPGDPAPDLSRLARSLWLGGGLGVAVALVACICAQVGEPRWVSHA